jgi:hypothetical protein
MQPELHSLAPRCPHCGEVIGVYEPLVVVIDGVPRETSRAAEPEVSATAGRAIYHSACHESLDGDGLAGA